MNKLMSLSAIAFALTMGLSAGVQAQTAPAAPAKAASAQAAPAKTAQQSRMAMCNQDASGKKGDERKAFMKGCLSAKKEMQATAAPTQQGKMKTCNVEAKGKKGDERKAFMKECLSK
ncbi:MAG: phosphate starvation-inducible protein PsiF [Polaromonas sp.]|nr:phosphate starvation-inducible protein PsiF [Polaromonas sp.]